MTKQSLWLVFLLVLFTGLFGYNYFFKPFAFTAQNIATSQLDSLSADQEQASQLSPRDQILASMTTRQKISQLLAVPLVVDSTFATVEQATKSAQLQWIQQSNPGTVVLFGSKVSTTAAKIASNAIHQPQVTATVSAYQIKPLVAVDHEGGAVQRLNGPGFTALPSWNASCKLDSVSAQIAIEQSAEELESVGIEVVLGPVLDIALPQNALKGRACSADYTTITERARLITGVYLSHNLVPVFKHFPGIGKSTKDLHTAFDSVFVSDEDAKLYRDLLTFYQDNPIGVMVSHVGVENQDPSVPCSLSQKCVAQLTANFEQLLVYSDDVLMTAAAQGLSAEERTLYRLVLSALLAGNQQVIIGPGADSEALNTVLLLIDDAYQKNSYIKNTIDQSAARVIDFKMARNQLQ